MDDGLAAALAAALLPDTRSRRLAEEHLQAVAAHPGFCSRLLDLTHPRSGLADSVRLLAATQLKNEAVRHWRRGATAAHEEERAALRAALVARLVEPEPCERVGVQLALAVARVMRSEANTGEATVLEAFAQTFACASLPDHALLALLHTAKELASMRLPAQRRLAARVGEVMLSLVAPLWEAALRSATADVSAATVSVVHAAVLHTKLLRRLVNLAAIDGGGGAGGAAGAADVVSTAGRWCAATACDVAVDAATALQRGFGGAPPPTWKECSQLGGATGKLIAALHALHPSASATMLDAAASLLMLEADVRGRLRRAAGGGGKPAANGAGGLGELEAREAYASALPAQLARLIEAASGDESWIAGVSAGARLTPLVHALVGLMTRSVGQLRRWAADPEAFACEALLPLDDDDDDDDDVGSIDHCGGGGEAAAVAAWVEGLEEEDDGGDHCLAGEDGDGEIGEIGDEGGGDGELTSGGGAPDEVLQRAADSCLAVLLCYAPEVVGSALLSLLPTAACTPTEPLDQQLYRDACYAALGIGAWQLQSALSFSRLLSAALNESVALEAMARARTSLALGPALQARLCWLLSCWWAFGGSGDPAEDVRLCGASYGFLSGLIDSGSDLAVRLQAAHVLRTLLADAADDDLEACLPHVPLALRGLATTLAACQADDATLAALRTVRTLVARAPAAALSSAAMQQSLAPTLEALWQRAAAERRVLIQRALLRVRMAAAGHAG